MSVILNLKEATEQKEKWKNDVFKEFYYTMTNTNEKFPCIFGTVGVKNQQVRYYFSHSPAETPDIHSLAKILEEYVNSARDFGKNTSLVVFFHPSPSSKTIQDYEKYFWQILQKLNQADPSDWPENIPQDTNDHLWEFSFSGEPLFVVCNSPAHKLRRSRYASTFMITFQPRWVFEFLQHPSGQKSIKAVRDILKTYDDIDIHPELGTYGNKKNKEWLQYYLSDNNEKVTKECPFKLPKQAMSNGVSLQKGNSITIEQAVMELLPETGSVEVQRDTPFREHKTHTHPTDETLLIISGEITFTVNDKNITCTSGDRILLAAHTKHSSIAGKNGCLYIIALEFKANQNGQ